jgi:serine phosphatase RsbU (regulator of sigma subunit)
MSYFDQRPQVFRIVFGIVAACLVVFAGFSVYQFGKSPSDENIFKNPPSRAYLTKAIPSGRWNSSTGRDENDSMRIGDLVLSVNGKKFPSLQECLTYLNTLSDTVLVELEISRPAEQEDYTYRTRKSSLPPDYVQEIQPTAMVTYVTEGGASDRAGMKVGDLITRINGQTFDNANGADAILRQGQIGKTIEYEILRNNKIITLQVTLASFGLQFAFLSFILCGLSYVATGVFLGTSRPQFAATRLLGVFFLATGYLMIVGILNRGLESAWMATLQSWSLTTFLCLAFPVLLHSFHYFPKDRPDLLKQKWILTTGYVLSLVAFVAIRTLTNWIPVVLVIVMAMYVFLIPLPFLKKCPADYKRMNRLVKWTSIIIGLVSASFGFFVPQESGVLALRLLIVFAIVLLAMPAAYLYTIGRYRLFNLVLRVRRSVQYSVVSIAWSVMLIVLLVALISWLVQENLKIPPYIRITSSSIEITDTPASQREQTTMERGILVALAIGATFTLLRIHRSGGRFISEKFYRARYDYRRAANELAEVMSTTLNMTQLAKGIVEKLASLMQLKRVGLLFFRDQEVCCCHEAHGFDGKTWDELCMRIDNHLVEGLKRFTREVNVDSLPAPLKETFRQREFHYIIPVRSKDKLVGTMLIGEKMSESAFTPEDLEFLAAVAKQASVAIENAFLYEELAGQERMKHELAIARKIQLESLPQSTPDIKGLDIAGISIPALEVGGDYFDYLNGDSSKLTIIVGDVSGKGTSAALYMSKVQGILRSLHEFGLSPRELFIRANHLLCRDLEKKSFVTAMGAAFDTKRKQLKLARAGHLPLFHFKAKTKKVEKIIPKGLGLGLSAEDLFANELEERRIGYAGGDVFVFVTDGITEGQKLNGDEFGEERLLKILEETSTSNALTIRDRVISDVKNFAGEASQHDDQTVVVVKAYQFKNQRSKLKKRAAI